MKVTTYSKKSSTTTSTTSASFLFHNSTVDTSKPDEVKLNSHAETQTDVTFPNPFYVSKDVIVEAEAKQHR